MKLIVNGIRVFVSLRFDGHVLLHSLREKNCDKSELLIIREREELYP